MSEQLSSGPVYTPPEQPEPPRQRRGVPSPRRPGGSWTSRLALVFSLIAMVLAGITLYLILSGRNQEPEEPPAPPEPLTIQFGGRAVEVLEGMPTRPYDHADFTLDEKGRVVYEKDGVRARTGIDVSFYQADIDWPAVAADGIDFAILRLGYRGYTQGGLMMDSLFEQNLQGALDAGLEVGVYFFSQAITPREAEMEADYVISALNGRALSYPIAFDWETVDASDARTNGMVGPELTQCARAFCERIQAAGYTPAVYFNQHLGYLYYDLRELTEFTLWLAEYDSQPDFYYHFDLWQYSHTGKVAGILNDKGEPVNVDLDLDLRPTLQGEQSQEAIT